MKNKKGADFMNKKVLTLGLCVLLSFGLISCNKEKDLNTRMSIDETNINEITRNQDRYLYQKVLVYGEVDYVDYDESYVYIDVEENQENEGGAFVVIKKDGYYYEGEEVKITGRIIDFVNGVHSCITDDGEVTYKEKVIYPIVEVLEEE